MKWGLSCALVVSVVASGTLLWGCIGWVGEDACTPDCAGRDCGDDGCGGSCGECDLPLDCGGGVCGEYSFDWVEIPGGSFWMGSAEGEGLANEHPRHQVEVPAFYMLRSEVTVEQYHQCVSAGVCVAPDQIYPSNYKCMRPGWGGPDLRQHPMNAVSWGMARLYCENWIQGRLPSEAEWEYAARNAGQEVVYPWGDEPASCEYAVMEEAPQFEGCGEYRTWPVCSKPAGNTEQGLCDMAGNTAEWVQDCYNETYDGAPMDGSAWPEAQCPPTPTSPNRVIRGGGWYLFPELLLARNRDNYHPSQQADFMGFRCAKEGP